MPFYAFFACQIHTETRNLKIQLIESQLEGLQIDYNTFTFKHTSGDNQGVFTRLLKQYIAKAKVSLDTLKSTDNRKKYNAAVRHLISNKLHFAALNRSIQRSLDAYSRVNKKRPAEEYQIFIIKESEGVSK
ncbi:MAG: hypothetical protein E6778_06645 [Niallia nealsonii]|nr:hypothetical protein [Niallia nealsonii]